MSAKSDFSTWLVQQLQERNWVQSELARRSGVSRQAISDYVNNKRPYPDKDALVAIARAFDLPPEEIFVAVGSFEQSPADDPTMKRIVRLYHKLRNPLNKQRALDYMQLLRQQEERENVGKK